MTDLKDLRPAMILGLAALLLGACGWWMSRSATSATATETREGSAATAPDGAQESTSLTRLVEGHDGREVAAPTNEEIAAPVEFVFPLESSTPPWAGPPFWVRVRVDGSVPPGAGIEARPALDEFGLASATPVTAAYPSPLAPAGDPAALLDIGPGLRQLLVNGQGATPRRLDVRLVSANHSTNWTEFRLPDPLPDAIADPRDAFEVVLQVQPAARVIGSLELPEGGAPAQAHVILYAMDGGKPSSRVAAWTSTEKGRFHLTVEGQGPFHLVALCKDLLPITKALILDPEATVDLAPLRFSPGHAVEGELAGHGAEGTPDSAVVSVMLEDADSLSSLPMGLPYPASGLGWIDRRACWFSWTAPVGPKGAFRIGGLPSRRHRINADPGRWRPFGAEDEREVTPPARIDLGIAFASIELEFELPPDHPVVSPSASANGKVSIEVDGTRRSTKKTLHLDVLSLGLDPPVDPLYIDLAPDVDARIEARIDGFHPVELELRTGARGTTQRRVVTLEPLTELCTVAFEFEGVVPAEGAPFRIVRRGSVDAEIKSKARFESGRLTLENQSPGEAEYELVPGRDRFAPDGHMVPIRVDVTVPEGGEHVVRVRGMLGGTLVVSAKDSTGRLVSGSAKIRDPDGERLRSVFVAQLPNGRVAGTDTLFDTAPSRRAGDLPPGVYTLELRAAGHGKLERTFEIHEGRTTDLVIDLP